MKAWWRALWRGQGARLVVANTAWLLGERGISLGLALTTHVWTARYLGASEFGALSYATALVGLFGSFTYLGLSGIVTRDLVVAPGSREELLGSSFLLKLAGAGAAFLLVNGVALWHLDDPATRTLVQVQSVGLFADAFLVLSFWYHARLEARYPVSASALAAMAAAALKVLFILQGRSLVWFGLAAAAQAGFNALFLCTIYALRGASLFAWRPSVSRARTLLSQSWPLALSSIVAVIYLKADLVMLGRMTDAQTTGVYSVAARLSEIWYVLPATLATSLFPGIVRARDLPPEIYRSKLQSLYRMMFLGSLAVAIPVSVAATPVVMLLYGEDYANAGRILAVHIWACPAMFMGSLLTKWLISEGLVKFVIVRDVVGASLNVALNLFLIPRLGGLGAAIATVLSYTIATYACCFADRRTVDTGLMMTKAIAAPVHYTVVLARRVVR